MLNFRVLYVGTNFPQTNLQTIYGKYHFFSKKNDYFFSLFSYYFFSRPFLKLFCKKAGVYFLILYICQIVSILFFIIMDSIENRRSIRKYSHRDVDQHLLLRLLEEAERTQNMGNLQLYSVVITRSEAKKAALAPSHFNQPMVMGAPVVLTFCADYHRTTRWCEERKAVPGYDNFLSFMNAMTDALLYCQNFCTLAEAEGLGLCYLGTTLYSSDKIIDVLELPQLVMPVATITLGWPDEQPLQSDRLPLSAVVHEETYQPVTRETIDRDYSPKEALPENQEFLRINNKETLAQIFTDLRYTKKDCEAISGVLLSTLRRQGFLD